MPADMASILLQSGDGQDYAKLIQLQRQQALAQSLMAQGQANPGNAQFGGLRNAGNAILGAFLAKRGDQGMADFYNPASSQSQAPPQPSGQVSNAPTPMPQTGLQTPPLSAQSGPTPQISNAPSQQSVAQAAPQGQPPQQTMMDRIYAGIPHIPGVPEQAAVRAYMNANPEYYKAYFDSMSPTPDQKNAAAAFGSGSQQERAALQGVVNKAGSIEGRNQAVVYTPDGVAHYGPNEEANTYYTTGPNNEPIAHQITNGASAAATTAGAVEAAKEQNKIIEVKLPDGRTIPMRAGDVVAYGGQGGQQPSSGVPNIDRNNPLNVSPGGQVSTYQNPTAGLGAAWDNLSAYGKRGINTVAGVMNTWAPVTDNSGRTINPNTPQNIAMISQKLGVKPDQPLNLSDPNVKGQLIDLMRPTETGNRYAGGNSPAAAASAAPQIGVSTAQEEVNKATGTAAANQAGVNAATQSLLSSINRALQINSQVPSGFGLPMGVGSAEAQEHLSNFGSHFGGSGDAAKYGALWDQEVGTNILNGLKTLKGLGRVDIPEVNQVIRTYGINKEDNPQAREAGLLNLRNLILNNQATSQNTLANLNKPGITQSTAREPLINHAVTLQSAPPANQRQMGQVYQTPKGPMKWVGNGWLPQ